MRAEIFIGGRGGQGILFMGYVLGLAASKMGYYVVQTESYTPETRGGLTTSELIISDEGPIDELRVEEADLAVLMFKGLGLRYSHVIRRDATVLIDSTFVDRRDVLSAWSVIEVPASSIALRRFGTPLPGNSVMLGALAEVTGLVTVKALREALKEVSRGPWLKKNLEALELGVEAVRGLTRPS